MQLAIDEKKSFIHTMFETFDSDGDGELDFEEFVKFSQKFSLWHSDPTYKGQKNVKSACARLSVTILSLCDLLWISYDIIICRLVVKWFVWIKVPKKSWHQVELKQEHVSFSHSCFGKNQAFVIDINVWIHSCTVGKDLVNLMAWIASETWPCFVPGVNATTMKPRSF